MKLKETIELLRSLQNPKEDYAGMVCAPAWAYGMRYVFPEPEDYTIEEAIEVLEKVDKYRWHDLKENPDDLPEWYEDVISVDVLIVTNKTHYPLIAFMDLELKEWYESNNCECLEDDFGEVIAWKYIEPFEKSVSLEENT